MCLRISVNGISILTKVIFAGAFLSLAFGRASEVVMFPVSSYGQALEGCVVSGFRTTGSEAGEVRDLKGQFHGLTGRGIPFGEYEADVRCGAGTLSRRIVVDQDKQFEAIAQFVGGVHEGRYPLLVIGLDPGGKGDAKYWLQVLGVFTDFRSSGGFDSQTGESSIAVPPTGSYVVMVLSTGGYQCALEVDLMQFTRHWIFHPATCTLDPDRYAHIVSAEDKLKHRSGEWYREMNRETELYFRQLREKADQPQ